jgi:hypothetical protein
MNRLHTSHLIKCTVDDLMYDIRTTSDPIRRTILKHFLEIKIRTMRAEQEDPSLEDLSNDDYELETNTDELESKTPSDEKKDNPGSESETNMSDEELKKLELEKILKKQKDSLTQLDKLSKGKITRDKMKAYMDIIEDNKRESDEEEIHMTRGKTERIWGSTYDPRYAKYVKEDSMNNKMMERLNSEIEFRCDETGKLNVEKPFSDGAPDNTETYAHYDNLIDDSRRYIPKKSKTQPIKKTNKLKNIGKRQSLF